MENKFTDSFEQILYRRYAISSLISALIFIFFSSCSFGNNKDDVNSLKATNKIDSSIKDTITLTIQRGIIKTKVINRAGEFVNYTLGDTFEVQVSFNEDLNKIIQRCELNIIPKSKENNQCFNIRRVSNTLFIINIYSECEFNFIEYSFDLYSDELLFKVHDGYTSNVRLVTQKNILIH